MKYIVEFEYTKQVSEDSWRVARHTAEISLQDSLEKILRWAVKLNNGRMPDKIEIREITIL